MRKAPAATATTAPTTSRSTRRCSRARVPGRPVRLQWMRDDEFKWEPYGAGDGDAGQGRARRDGRIADWEYELWSNSHSTRPASSTGTNVLAAWYLAEPQKMGPPTSPPQPAGGGDRNSIPLYDFPSQRVMHHFVQDMPIRVSALRTLGAYANVFALGILHGRAGGGGRRRSGRLPARAHEGPARPRRDRGGGQEGGLEGRREGRRHGAAAASASPSTRTSPATWPWSRRWRSTAQAAWCACRAPGRRSIPG